MSAKPRHPATAKAWEWFETDPHALGLPTEQRTNIRERLEDLDADFLEWDGPQWYDQPTKGDT